MRPIVDASARLVGGAVAIANAIQQRKNQIKENSMQNKSALPNELITVFANCTTKIFLASTEKDTADYKILGLSKDEAKKMRTGRK